MSSDLATFHPQFQAADSSFRKADWLIGEMEKADRIIDTL